MAGVMGDQAKLCVGALATPGVIDATAKPLDFQSEGLRQTTEVIDANGLKGTRSRYSARTRQGRQRVAGPIVLQPTFVELASVLPYVLGGTPAGTSYPLGENLTAFSVAIDRVLKVFTYAGCAVSRGTFTARQGQALELSLELVGQTETVGNAGTFPALTIDATTRVIVLSDLVLTVAGSTYQTDNFTLTIDNAVDAERFFNSRTLVSALPTDRTVTFTASVPYGDSSGLYAAVTAGTPFSASAVFTDGATSLSLALTDVLSEAQSPVVGGRSEIMLPVGGRVLRSVSTPELVVTLDSTP